MLLLEQLQLSFEEKLTLAASRFAQRSGYGDDELTDQARELLQSSGARRTAREVRVQWNSRLKSCAGRADYRHKLVSLNPRLRDFGAEEVEQTLRHELAHLLAQARAGNRRIAPHGAEWRKACRDLGIAGEARCHTLPLPVNRRMRRFLYKCPSCSMSFARVRRIRRAVACLACCRAHNRGRFDARFRLRLVEKK
jgi:predicted SprT family Zn-dependent metalloprotease